MVTTVQILKNAAVLDKFDELTSQNCNPALGVYRGRSIVLLSEGKTGVIAKIKDVWNMVVDGILSTFGLLSTDIKEIEKLTDEVNGYFQKRLAQHYGTELLQANNKLTRQQAALAALQASIVDEEEKKNKLTKEVSDLEERADVAKSELNSHDCHFAKCEEMKGQIAGIKAQKATMQNEIEEVTQRYNQLPAMNQAIISLQGQRADLQAEVERLEKSRQQHDYKRKWERLSADNQQLQGQISALQTSLQKHQTEISKLKDVQQQIVRDNQTEINRLRSENAHLHGQVQATQRIAVGTEGVSADTPANTRIPVANSDGSAAVSKGTDRVPVKKK